MSLVIKLGANAHVRQSGFVPDSVVLNGAKYTNQGV